MSNDEHLTEAELDSYRAGFFALEDSTFKSLLELADKYRADRDKAMTRFIYDFSQLVSRFQNFNNDTKIRRKK